MKIKYLLILFVIFLVYCHVDEKASQISGSPLLGVWQTESCKEITDENGISLNLWARGIYHFLPNGDINAALEPYSDSNCTIIDATFSSANTLTVATFQDIGEEPLQEGLSGHRVNITFLSPDQIITTEAFYTISDNVLCFSLSYSFEPTSFRVSPNVIPDIDFTRCLVPDI